jgi:hypothetical protein
LDNSFEKKIIIAHIEEKEEALVARDMSMY